LVAARFRDSEIQRFSEMSKFQKFYLYCAVHDSVFDSLQAVAKHRRDKNENPRNVKIICGECGELFRTMEDLAKHCNVAKFANRVSTIKNYNKHSFDYKQHFQFITRQSSVSAAAARARNEEAAKRHAIFSEPKLPSNLFSSPSVVFPPPPLSPSSISAPVSHFEHVIESFHLPPPLSPISDLHTDTDNDSDISQDTLQTDLQRTDTDDDSDIFSNDTLQSDQQETISDNNTYTFSQDNLQTDQQVPYM